MLAREEERIQHPVYYVSKALYEVELRYSPLEKLAYAVVIVARKLRPYFLEHPIEILTNYPLRQVLQNPDTSERLVKWAVELGQFDIKYKPRTSIKGQALTDFVAEFNSDLAEEPGHDKPWELFVDGSSTEARAGARIILFSPSHQLLCEALLFDFSVFNNEAEYEAPIAGLRMAKEMKIDRLVVHRDSQLVVNQINEAYQMKEERMNSYIQIVKRELKNFQNVLIKQIPRTQNSHVDALVQLTTSEGIENFDSIQ